MEPLFGAPNKGFTFLYGLRSPKTLLNPLVNGKIQGLFKAFECFSSTFQGKDFSRQLSIFQACVNPVKHAYSWSDAG